MKAAVFHGPNQPLKIEDVPVPEIKDDEIDDIIIQFNQRGLTRFTREVSVSGSIRFRTWRLFTLHHAGEWEVKVLHDKGTEVETLRTLTLTVIE